MRAREIAGVSAGLIAPSAFLPVAEEFGLITEIDRWVIDRAAEIAATGDAVQINVSARSVSDPSLVDYIKHAIQRSGADPGKIMFEITETTLVSDQAAGRAFVERLHGFGCKVALDDFGTGYGGFTYLKQLPIDFLKIDIEFVRDLTNSSASRHVVEAVVSLAAGFGLKTVGEGVEDQATLDLLRELGVDYGQGFHIGRPAAWHTTNQTHDTKGQRTWTTQTEPRGLESSANSTRSRRSSISIKASPNANKPAPTATSTASTRHS
jgi:EAL domain-containing protein (putative c-di-GMP-specific phosphodiesterase class I)